MPRLVGMLNIKGHDIARRVYDADDTAPTLHTVGGAWRK